MNTSVFPYLRLSVSDRCNFNCFYCQPALRQNFLAEGDMLDLGELFLLVKELSHYGIRHVRLTGGEPLLRENITDFIKTLSALSQLECLSLTTNGYHLSPFLRDLKTAGIVKINISLDTLKRERFMKLTGIDAFAKVQDAIFNAKKFGIEHVKLNILLMKGFNDDEIFDFVDFGLFHRVDVRFIEYFPTNPKVDIFQESFIPSKDVFKAIEDRYGRLEFLGPDPLSGPAQYFRIKEEEARIGFISSVTEFFCDDCNRLRLTSDGKLYLCLHADYYADLKQPLREGDTKGLSRLILDSLSRKKLYNKTTCARSFEMSSIGG